MAASAETLSSDNETITLLSDSARDFCARELPVTRLRDWRGQQPAFSPAAWREMCELGWPAILVPENRGGLGLGASAVGAVCRELGRVVAPEPLIECGVAAAALLGQLPDDSDVLSGLLSGTTLVGLAWSEPQDFSARPGDGLSATLDSEELTLNGDIRGLSQGSAMDHWLVPATLNDTNAVVLLDSNAAGLVITDRQQSDGTALSDISARDVRLPAHCVLLQGAEAAKLFRRSRELAQLAASAYLLGLAEAVFEITLEYLKTRKQFGQPIGSFQALQHRAVDLYIHQRVAAAVVTQALGQYDSADSDEARATAASRAKYRANEAALQLGRQAVQLHGGIGYTDECDVGLYLNRALAVAAALGTSTQHAQALAGLIREGDDDTELAVTLPQQLPENGHWDDLTDDQFRQAVRNFFEAEYPSELRYPPARLRWKQIKPWYLTLSERGWVAPAWPAEHGGMGLSPGKLLIYMEEQERHGIGRAPDMGIQMVGPLLIKHGTEEQRQRYLPKILAGEEIWCQGYSEPNAGSDLASLMTEAVADGDEFVINGQKTWTTLAQDATHMFCLARTDKTGKPQRGISFFLIDFKQPGVTIRPIRNIAGHEEFCEVFLDDVRVSADSLVGEINQGWTIAKALLGFERIFIGSPKQSQYALKRLELMAANAGLYNNAAFVDRLTRLKLDVLDLAATFEGFADIVRRGETLGPDVSLLKIWSTETFARLSELMVEAAGADGAVKGQINFGDDHIDVMSQFYNARPATIYGGSNEIQRNIIAKGVLNLPNN